MNRTLVLGIAIFFAVVGIALVGGEKTAVAGRHHGCNGARVVVRRIAVAVAAVAMARRHRHRCHGCNGGCDGAAADCCGCHGRRHHHRRCCGNPCCGPVAGGCNGGCVVVVLLAAPGQPEAAPAAPGTPPAPRPRRTSPLN